MKIMNVSLTIDVQNPQQVHALKQLMDALGGNELAAAPTPVVNFNSEQLSELQKKFIPAEKAKRTRQPKAVAEEPSQAEEPQQVAEEMAQAPGPDPVEKINLATLRALTAEKAATHRAEIKEKLAELGAANVTSIPEDKFNEYHDFITSL